MCFLPFYFVWLCFNPLPIPYDILVCFILCRMVSFLCIFVELIYPQFCSHIIHTSVYKLYFIHRGSFLLCVYSENIPAFFTCFSRIFGCKFGAKRAFLQSCFFIIFRYTRCRMLWFCIFHFKRMTICILSRVPIYNFLLLELKIQRLSAISILYQVLHFVPDGNFRDHFVVVVVYFFASKFLRAFILLFISVVVVVVVLNLKHLHLHLHLHPHIHIHVKIVAFFQRSLTFVAFLKKQKKHLVLWLSFHFCA